MLPWHGRCLRSTASGAGGGRTVGIRVAFVTAAGSGASHDPRTQMRRGHAGRDDSYAGYPASTRRRFTMTKPRCRDAGEARSTRATRRRFLKSAGAGAGIAALAAAGAGPFVFARNARAADKELKIIQWSHFVPAYDKWFDQIVKDWGAANRVNATADHIPHLESPDRMAAEV